MKEERTPNKTVAFSTVSSVQAARHDQLNSAPCMLMKTERFAVVESIEIIAAMADFCRKKNQTSDSAFEDERGITDMTSRRCFAGEDRAISKD